MTGLMDKAIAMVKMSFIDMRFFSTQLIMYLETTGYFLASYLKKVTCPDKILLVLFF
jgi:hypothetical protein